MTVKEKDNKLRAMQIKKEDIGIRIKEVREGLKMTQATLGRILGVGNKAVSAYEKGAANPSPSSLAEIARLGKCTIDWLVTGATPDTPINQSITYPIAEDEKSALKTCENLIARYGLETRYAVVEIHHPPPQEERLSEDEKQLLKYFRQLDQHKKTGVLDVAAAFALAVRESLEKESPERDSKERKFA